MADEKDTGATGTDTQTADTTTADTSTTQAADTTATTTAADTTTVLDAKTGEEDTKAVVGDFPDDWREKLAGDDAKFLSTLKRYSSPKSFSDAFKALRQKMSSGELKESLKVDASPEELAEYRKQNGIPDAPAAYLEKLPDGIVIGDDDKPAFEKLAATLHAQNAPKAIYDAVAATYVEVLEDQRAAEFQQATDAKAQTEDELRAEWGGDYRRNVNLVNGFLDSAPDEVGSLLKSARLADGTPLASHAATLRWFADLAREINPVATVVPGAGANQASAIKDELSTLTKMMGNKNSDYWKGPNAEKNQARYRELITADQKLQARAA